MSGTILMLFEFIRLITGYIYIPGNLGNFVYRYDDCSVKIYEIVLQIEMERIEGFYKILTDLHGSIGQEQIYIKMYQKTLKSVNKLRDQKAYFNNLMIDDNKDKIIRSLHILDYKIKMLHYRLKSLLLNHKRENLNIQNIVVKIRNIQDDCISFHEYKLMIKQKIIDIIADINIEYDKLSNAKDIRSLSINKKYRNTNERCRSRLESIDDMFILESKGLFKDINDMRRYINILTNIGN